MNSHPDDFTFAIIDNLSKLIKFHGMRARAEELAAAFHGDTSEESDKLIKQHASAYNTLRYTRDSLEDLFYRKS